MGYNYGMEHLALYRKYRPLVFKDVIGQAHITDTLINQIFKDRVSHAYLFTGSRGTGKTTCAKIFAKAVNCTSPDNGSPCGKCEVCKALSDPSNLDITEIDAASNNKVDEVREIRERVKYPPVSGKKKVYIIDEVHMLTDSAFNALLKTLEEPPKHVVFILATTEVHKLPATIVSRCIRFDFKLLPLEELKKHLEKIFKQEGKKVEEAALYRLAAAGEGSVRDALSIADMCINYREGKLTLADVNEVLGATDRTKVESLVAAIAEINLKETLKTIGEIAASGKSMQLLLKEIISYIRDLLAAKTGCEKMIADTKENIERYAKSAGGMTEEYLLSLLHIFSQKEPELKYSLTPQIVLETVALSACKLISVDLNALEARIKRLESKLEEISILGFAPPPDMGGAEKAPQNLSAKAVWGRIVTHFRTDESMRLYTLVSAFSDVEIEGGKLIIHASDDDYLAFSDKETIAAITRALLSQGIHLEVMVDKRRESVDMDEEIANLKKMMGGATLNITK